MAATEKFKQDILLKEEAFLIEVKAKLTDQLNRLKVYYCNSCVVDRSLTGQKQAEAMGYKFTY